MYSIYVLFRYIVDWVNVVSSHAENVPQLTVNKLYFESMHLCGPSDLALEQAYAASKPLQVSMPSKYESTLKP